MWFKNNGGTLMSKEISEETTRKNVSIATSFTADLTLNRPEFNCDLSELWRGVNKCSLNR
jgi:hypothetical protein